MTTQWDILTGDPERDRRNVSILLESVEELYGPRTLDALLCSAVDRAIRVTGAERGMLLLEGGDGELRTTVARTGAGQSLPLDERYSGTVVAKVWRSGEAFLTMDTPDQQMDLSKSMVDLRLLSVMAVPLPVKSRSLGVLYVDSQVKVKEFTQSDFSVFQALGGLIALAVENAHLMAQQEEQERLKRELLVAQKIQQRLLPTDLPQPAGFELAGFGRPCDETSGDYYDAVSTNDGCVALIVGDVSGHGLGPALLMASTRALLHSALDTSCDPVKVMSSVNRFLERDTPDNVFMSLFLGILDPVARTLQYVSAGHNPPFLMHADGSLEELQRTGTVLGVLPDIDYQVSEPYLMAPGDALILYTDGVFEAHNRRGEMYGEERFQKSFVRNTNRHPRARGVIDSILADLDAFVEDAPLDDDVTVLVMRVR